MYKSRDSSRSGGGGGGSSSRSSGSGSHRSSSGSRFSGGGGDRRGPGGGDRGRGGPPLQKRGDELNSMRIDKPNFANMELRSFQKEFYRESTSAAGRAQNDLANFYREFNVVVNHVGQSRTLRPVLEFTELTECVPRPILDRMRDCNYDRPTTIQSFCWPTLLSGLNMVGVAQTGSGKTLGFLLPMLVHIYNNERYVKSFGRDALPGPVGLVLAPTRELAQQIQEVAENFGRVIGVNNIVIYGGAAKGPQMGQMRRGADIYIATPGRLLDFLKENVISLQKCSFLVLDEADRMLDMGFEPQIRKIIEQIRPDRQTAMFSATWPKEVRKLAEDFIWNYAHISIGTTVLTANPNIRQHVEVVDDEQKEQRLRQVLGEIMNERDSKAIVFAETKRRVDAISVFIKKLGFYCLTIHGDKKQQEREWVLSEFKQKPKCILVATDVAARGLNIEDIKYVINVDYPQQTEDYVHRIGRTARNSNAGTSYTFLTRQNARHASALVDVLRETNQEISDELMSLCGGRGHFNRNGGGPGGKFRNGPGSAPSGPRYGGNRPNESNNNTRPSYSNGTNPSINNRGESNGYNGYNNHTNGGSQEYGRKPAQQYGPPTPAIKRDYSDLSESNGGSQNGGGYPYETRSHDPKRQRTSNNRWEDNNTSPTKFNPAAPPPSLSVPPPSRFAGGYQNGHNGAALAAPAAAPGYNGIESDLLASFKLAPPPPPPTGAPANVPPVGLPLTARPPPQAIYQGYQAYY